MNVPNLKSHSWRSVRRMAAIALSAGTLITGLAPTAFAQYNPPADLGLPSRREPGGTRGSCPAALPVSEVNGLDISGLPTSLASEQAPGTPTITAVNTTSKADLSLTPLMPQDNHFGQTVSPYPTFYWYVPEVTAKAAEFVLIDETDNEIYSVKFQLQQTDQGGLISLSLPANAGLAPLKVDQNYKWYFSLICDEFDRGTDIFTDGWVRRVAEPDTPLVTANDYAQAGIWFEALEILAEEKRLETDGVLNPEWRSLLESVGLGDFVEVAFR
ncbi:MAG: DUF928 domain-containing protein [Cyanobacteria bacterium P01_F01_bin.150]